MAKLLKSFSAFELGNFDREFSMKKIFLLAVLTLAACSAQPATPVLNPTAEIPPTATQPPTATAIPLPTVSPEMIALQEEIAKTENFTFRTDDGTLEYKGNIYKGLKFDGTGKMWHITLADGTEVSLTKDQVSISDENGIYVEGFVYDSVKGRFIAVEYPEYFANLSIEQANVEIKTKEDIAEIQNIEWEDMTNLKFANWIKDQYRAGNIEPFGPEVKPLKINETPNVNIVQKYGYAPMYESANFIASEEETPIRAVGYFVSTDGEGLKHLIIPHYMKVGEGENDVRVMLEDLPWIEKLNDIGFFKQVLKGNIYKENVGDVMIVPARIRDLKACDKYVGGSSGGGRQSCEQYYLKTYPRVIELVRELMKGNFPDELEGMPILTTSISIH
ncbi:MAG: hypothetical protein KA473_14765 [Anaerolineales bacterium]|nr:hypothetical protein [Anaerolineales bacterium]